jgi:hypothetical protein
MRNNVAVSANRTIDGVTISALVHNINVKSVAVTDDRAFDSADYTF